MSQKKSGGSFVESLGRIYLIYTGGFIGFVIFLAILEQVGVADEVLGYLFVGLTITVYALIGILSRTARVSEYYVAGRNVPPVFNGMATGADWMSGASFVALAGSIYALGYDGLAFVLGWTGGYVLVATLIAPYLRKFGAYTVPDFLGQRYEGNLARTIGVVILFCCSFVYVVAQIRSTGIIASRFLGIPYEIAVFVGLVGILVCSMLGGMRAVTWTQVAQYIILIIAYLVPVVILSFQRYGIPIPQLTYGLALAEIANIEPGLGITSEKGYTSPFVIYDPLNFFALIFCLMLGTASLPHVLMRFFTTPSVKSARRSVGWALFFIFLLYFTAPAYAAFAKLEVYSTVIGSNIADLPGWVEKWGPQGVGLIKIDDLNADGILQLAEFTIARDVVVLATPEIAGLPYVIAGLVAAGGLAAALSTADGLLLAIANAFSHDIYYRMVNTEANTQRRLVVARVILVVVAILAAFTATSAPPDILKLVAWAFSLAAAGLFPALVLGIWSTRVNSQGAIIGMIAGFAVTLFYLAGTQYFGMGKWFGLNNISAGLFGVPVNFIVTLVVSNMTAAPSDDMQRFIRSLRHPRGGTLMEEKE